MTTSCTPREFITGPLYFFDQPSAQDRRNGKPRHSNILHLNLTNGAVRKSSNKGGKTDDQDAQRMSQDTCVHIKHDKPCVVNGESSPDAVPADGTVDAYRHAAPQLLAELARLLSQHRWAEEGGVPRGLQNILHYSWRELTAGAVYPKRPWKNEGDDVSRLHSKSSLNTGEISLQVAVKDQKGGESVVENTGSAERKTVESPRGFQKKIFISKPIRAPALNTIMFSTASESCKEKGWVVQPQKASYDEPEWNTLCQWVVERLQMARISINIQAAREAAQGLDEPPVLRHYGEARTCLRNKTAGGKACPVTLPNGMPRIPEVKEKDPARQKLHYRVNDGSSIVYYPSGHVAVCQSHSGLARGGFCTNVFSDSESPNIIASVTVFGHGTVTHPLSGFITAQWDQAGGVLCDPNGTVIKHWSWPINPLPKNTIVIQVSDLISLRLFSGTTAVLVFQSCSESVRLPLSALSNTPPQEKEEMCPLKTGERFLSQTARTPLLAKRRNPPTRALESKRTLAPKSASVRPCEGVQMAGDVEGPAEPSELRRGRGHTGKELRRLQQRIHNTLYRWLAYLCTATGIQCPDIDRSRDVPPRTRLKRGAQSAALPSLNPPGQADSQPGEGAKGLHEPHRHLCAPVDCPLSPTLKLPSSVTVLRSAELQPPVQPSSLCPALLRAALTGDRGRRVCCCSSRLMPAVTDLEYDAFVAHPHPHSKQILVVCVSPPRQGHRTPAPYAPQDSLEKLYERRNRNRTRPCFQCKMDSFRLVRYELPTGKASSDQNTLLQHRHNAAPGMALMYIRGKLLFADYIFNGYSCLARDLHKQISRTRADYRLGLSLPPDYRFSATMQRPAARASLNAPTPQKPVPRSDPVECSSSPEKGKVKGKM